MSNLLWMSYTNSGMLFIRKITLTIKHNYNCISTKYISTRISPFLLILASILRSPFATPTKIKAPPFFSQNELIYKFIYWAITDRENVRLSSLYDCPNRHQFFETTTDLWTWNIAHLWYPWRFKTDTVNTWSLSRTNCKRVLAEVHFF